jgi:membrane protease YdiL (CAAX protease family)
MWLLYSILLGLGLCIITYAVANYLYQDDISNWFVYISRSYSVSGTDLTDADRLIYFVIYSIIGMTFSPVGEELFYRGLIQGSFKNKFGSNQASTIDSLAFALTHLAHFGIAYTAAGWKFLPAPALLWVSFMFLASKLFFLCKERSGSILGPILAHAGFNVTMMYFIFYHVLR